MSQMQIDLSASKGYAKKTGNTNNTFSDKNNLIYTADNGEVVSGVYNPFRQSGYIAPATNAWVDISFRIPDVDKLSSPNKVVGVLTNSISQPVLISTTDYQYLSSGYSKGASTTIWGYLKNTSPTTNVHSMIVHERDGDRFLYSVSNNKVQSQLLSNVLNYGIERNDWQSNVAINPQSINSLNGNNQAGLVDGKNRILYIYDRFSVHGADGSDVVPAVGVFNGNILTFPKDFILTAAAEFKGNLYFTYNYETDYQLNLNISDKPTSGIIANRSGVFIWNKKSITGSAYESVTIDGCKEIRHIWNDGESLFLISISLSGKCQIRRFNGVVFDIIYEIGDKEDDTMLYPSSIDAGLVTECIVGKNAITYTEKGSIFSTNFGNIYLLEMGGIALHKIGKLQYEEKDASKVNITESTISSGNNDFVIGMDYSASSNLFIATGSQAVGINGILYSTGGSSWSSLSLPTYNGNTIASVAYSPTLNIWVATLLSGSTRAISSTSPTTSWTSRTINNSLQWGCVKWIGGTINKFIAIPFEDQTDFAYSSNGTTWTAGNFPETKKTFNGALSITYNTNTNTIVFVDTDGKIFTSTDGVTWTKITTDLPVLANGIITYSPTLNKYVMCTAGTYIYYSTNLTNWTMSTTLGKNSSRKFLQWIPEYNKFAIQQSGLVMLSSDGDIWNSYNSQGGDGIAAMWVGSLNKFVSIGFSNPTKLLTGNFDVTEMTLNTNMSNESSSAIFYIGDNGYKTDNLNAGLTAIVPHIHLAYFSANNGISLSEMYNQGLRMQKYFLHNLVKISSIDMEGEVFFNDTGKFDKDIYPLEGNVLTGVTLLPKLSLAQNITIYCKPVPNENPSLSDAIIGWIDIYLNQSETPTQTKAVTRHIASKGYIDIELNRQNCNAIQIGIRWNEEHQTGENDMLLSQAVFTYKTIYSSR